MYNENQKEDLIMKKQKAITIRVDEQEHSNFKVHSASKGMTIKEFGRKVLKKYLVKK